jgi:tetratricopeptide (TPR) repeat protein
VAVGVGQAHGQPASVAPWAEKLLTAYDRADLVAVERELPSILNLARFRDDFPVEAGEWIDLADPQHRDRRRAIAATVALEVANQGGPNQWRREGEALLEWACSLIRKSDRRTNAERLWHWAAIALLSGAANGERLEGHVQHARARFPDEPRFLLANALAAELRTWPDSREGNSIPTRYRDLAIARLKEAALHDSTRAEAELRLGYLTLRTKRPTEALEHLSRVQTSDAHLKYLAYLFQGRALDRMHRAAEAVEAYRSAIGLAPKAQTAQLALALALARNGERAEAERAGLVAVTMEPGYDPWLDYGDGDARFWRPILAALRQALK